MDRYKKVIKLRILLLSILVIFSVILGIYDVFLTSPEVKESDLFSFQCGSTSALSNYYHSLQRDVTRRKEIEASVQQGKR
jgi:hypothetical protein